MMEKSRISESLLEFLKENQKTVNKVITLSSGDQDSQHQYPRQAAANQPTSVSLSEVLEKMSELIELNKVTLQTIDLLDKRIKRMHMQMNPEMPRMEEREDRTEEGEKVQYADE